MEITRYKNDEIRERQKKTSLLTRKQAEAINDMLVDRLKRLPLSSSRSIAQAIDLLTEAGMYAFNATFITCNKCDKETWVDRDAGHCAYCGENLQAAIYDFSHHREKTKSPETTDLPKIEQFKPEESGDEEILTILAEIENLKVGCPEEWDVWDDLSDAQAALMSFDPAKEEK